MFWHPCCARSSVAGLHLFHPFLAPFSCIRLLAVLAQLPHLWPDADVILVNLARSHHRHVLIPRPYPFRVRAQLPRVRPDAGVVAAPGALVPPPVPGARVCGGRRGRAGAPTGNCSMLDTCPTSRAALCDACCRLQVLRRHLLHACQCSFSMLAVLKLLHQGVSM